MTTTIDIDSPATEEIITAFLIEASSEFTKILFDAAQKVIEDNGFISIRQLQESRRKAHYQIGSKIKQFK